MKIGLVLTSLTILALVGGGARNSSAATAKYYPPLLDDFQVYVGGKMPDGTLRFSVALNYGGGLFPIYPQLRPHDSIPAVKIQLTLPSGVHIVRSKFKLSPPNNGKFYTRYPAKNFRWKMVNGHPTWVFYDLRELPMPAWLFYVNLPDPAQPVCISEVASFPGVLHAPVEKLTQPDCYQPGTK